MTAGGTTLHSGDLMHCSLGTYSVRPKVVHGFLLETLPFNELPAEELEILAEESLVDFFIKGTVIIVQDVTEVDYVYLVQRGAVKVYLTTRDREVMLKEYGGTGHSFGAESILRNRTADFTVETVEDTFCVLIDRTRFLKVVESNPGLKSYYWEGFEKQRMSAVYSELIIEKPSSTMDLAVDLFSGRVGHLVRRDLELVPADTTVSEAAARMVATGADALLVVDENRAALGIVTNSDLRTKVVAAGLDYGTNVAHIMTNPVRRIPARAACFDALVMMIERQVNYLAVEHRDEFIGLVSASDMMVHLGASTLFLFREIAAQRKIESLHELSQRVPVLVRRLLLEGARAGNITRMITIFNDMILRRILILVEETLGPPPVPYAWLALGSEGRKEQTFRTDQDNALIYEDPRDDAQARQAKEYFRELGSTAVDHLEACGYPRCKNKFMASNPRWCAPYSTWTQYFDEWILTPMPPEITLSMIFFDFRASYGNTELAERLRDHVHGRAIQHPGFLKYFSRYALVNAPPVSFFENAVVEKDGSKTDLLDLKTRCITPIVDCARVLALQHGIVETGTVGRFEMLAECGCIPRDLYEDAGEAYEFEIHLNLIHQLKMVEAGERPHNYIDPAMLAELERKTLQRVFAVIDRLLDFVRRTAVDSGTADRAER